MSYPIQQPLPDWIKAAYETLVPVFETSEAGLTRGEAQAQLLNSADGPDDPTDCDYALDRLLDRGWLYQVDGELRKTN